MECYLFPTHYCFLPLLYNLCWISKSLDPKVSDYGLYEINVRFHLVWSRVALVTELCKEKLKELLYPLSARWLWFSSWKQHLCLQGKYVYPPQRCITGGYAHLYKIICRGFQVFFFYLPDVEFLWLMWVRLNLLKTALMGASVTRLFALQCDCLFVMLFIENKTIWRVYAFE